MAAATGLLFLVYAKLAAVQALPIAYLLIAYFLLFFVGVYLNAKGKTNKWCRNIGTSTSG